MRTRPVRSRGRTVRLALAAALAAAILVALAACSVSDGSARPAKQQAPAAAKASANPTAETVFPVSLVQASLGELSDYVSVNGGVEPETQVEVYADTTGKLVKVNVRLGQYVTADAVIAEVDPSRPGQNYVPSPVRAPIAGTITALPADVGTRITQGLPVAEISTLSRLQVRTQVAERYIGRLHLGEAAVAALEAYPGELFAAQVSELSPVVDPQTRTMEVTLTFSLPDPRIKPGMFAEVKIITLHKTGVVKVPADSIIEKDGVTFVYLCGPNDTAVRRAVDVGINIDGKAEINQGLKAGDRVVARGQTLIADGAHLKVVEELPPLPSADSLK